MDKLYYKEYYKLEREHWWFKARLQILEKLIKKKIFKNQPLTILNAGAATGATSLMLKNYGKVKSLEYDKECADFLSEILEEEVSNASLTELPFEENTFDLVCAFDVIEHIEDDHKAVAESYKVIKENGYIFLTVPAFQELWSNHDEINHHYRRYRLKELINLVEKNGFEVVYSTYFNFILFMPIFIIRKLSKLLPSKKEKESTGSDFEKFKSNKILDSILNRVLLSENHLLNLNLTLPFGVSALIIGIKKGT